MNEQKNIEESAWKRATKHPDVRFSLKTALIAPLICIIFGVVFDKPHLWIPISTAIAKLIYAPFHPWCCSSLRGTNEVLSELLKLVLSAIGFYGTVGGWACIALPFYWFFFLK